MNPDGLSGVMYMLKLHHLVEDKIHATCLIMMSPLRSNRWVVKSSIRWSALRGNGSSGTQHMAQPIRFKFLTVKSDDISGRTTMYEAIVKGGANRS